VTVWVVLVAAALTTIVGLAVDLSGRVTTLRLASDVAAQAARAAGQELDADTYTDTGSLEIAAARAKTAAIAYTQAAGMTGTARIDGADLVVDVTASYEPVFLSAIGIGTQQVTATASVRAVRALEGTQR
jgi:Flp pilus assembly protein TadG